MLSLCSVKLTGKNFQSKIPTYFSIPITPPSLLIRYELKSKPGWQSPVQPHVFNNGKIQPALRSFCIGSSNCSVITPLLNCKDKCNFWMIAETLSSLRKDKQELAAFLFCYVLFELFKGKCNHTDLPRLACKRALIFIWLNSAVLYERGSVHVV